MYPKYFQTSTSKYYVTVKRMGGQNYHLKTVVQRFSFIVWQSMNKQKLWFVIFYLLNM